MASVAARSWCGTWWMALGAVMPLKGSTRRCAFNLIEDNDPSGNMSKKGVAAKRAARLKVVPIPKYSPDLNVMDYAVWAEIEKSMRCQERAWPAQKRETRDAFIRRLARTTKAIPTDFVNRSIMDMKRRCQLLLKAKGGLFQEGGRRPRVS